MIGDALVLQFDVELGQIVAIELGVCLSSLTDTGVISETAVVKASYFMLF